MTKTINHRGETNPRPDAIAPAVIRQRNGKLAKFVDAPHYNGPNDTWFVHYQNDQITFSLYWSSMTEYADGREHDLDCVDEIYDWPQACKLGAKDLGHGRPLTLYEITEEAYWWGLECVPPAWMYSTAYLCGEPYTHNNNGDPLFSFGVRLNDKYYSGPILTEAEAKALTREQVEAAIERGKEQLTAA